MSPNEVSRTTPHQLLTEPEAALWLHHSLPILRRWRRQNGGPQFFRAGRRIFYPIRCLEEFLASHLSPREGK